MPASLGFIKQDIFSVVPSEDAAMSVTVETLMRKSGLSRDLACRLVMRVWRDALRWQFTHPDTATGADYFPGH